MPAESRRDRLERLTNLVLVLLDASQPLTLQELTDQVAGYPEGKERARQAFERDKRALRDLGIPVTNVRAPRDGQVAYVLRSEDYYLPELDLDEAESQALAFAVAAVQLGGSAGRNALSTLGHLTGSAVAAPVAVLPSLPALSVVHEALRERALLHFRYHGIEREVEPSGLAFRHGAWYLVARDRSRGGATRTFRVDRLESEPVRGAKGAFEPPPHLDVTEEVHLLPFSAVSSDDLPEAELEVDARMARHVASLVPAESIDGWLADGSVVVRLRVSEIEPFVSFVAGLGDAAVVRGPTELRHVVVDRLQAMVATTTVQASEIAVPAGRRLPEVEAAAEAADDVAAPPGRAPGASSGRGTEESRGATTSASTPLVAGERLRRLLAILVHLARVGEADISALARRFEMDELELVHDLELAACCGVPPYTPDQLIELIVEGDAVTATALGHLAKPRRLTPEEGFTLAAAGEALCQVQGAAEESALRSALGKLSRALGASVLSVEVTKPRFLEELQRAAAEREQVEIEYVSSASLDPTTRRVDPYQVVTRQGRWYVDGWCHRAGGVRRFQLERVQSLRRTGECFEPPEALDESLTGPAAFVGGPDTVKVRIAFPVGSELGVEQVAASPLERLEDGRFATDLLVGDVEGFLGRILLRLGPGSEVLEPPELACAGALAAQRALRRYEEDSGVPS